ncbi:MAG: hypothetical protein K9W43_12060 [Candidatus Thorarchaeota archaeon]|nr:hypothetical protein [Candidatus Thorarchaeota archaeon]
MAQTVDTFKSVFTQTDSQGQRYKPISRIAGFGGLLGVFAALVGIVTIILPGTLPAGSLVQLPFQAQQYLLEYPLSITLSALFLGLLAIGALLQATAAKRLGRLLESGYPSIFWVTGLVLAGVAAVVVSGLGIDTTRLIDVEDYISNMALITAFVVIMWQLTSVIYIDTSKSYIGMLAGLLNGFFWPIYAIAFSTPALYGVGVTAAFVVLLVGQLFTAMYWWMPETHIREYARSTPTARFGFGIAGLMTFIIGSVAVFTGPLTAKGNTIVWIPWSTYESVTVNEKVYFSSWITAPWLVQGFLAAIIIWVMLAPRLGSVELSTSEASGDIISGGMKWFMVFLAIIGIFGTTIGSSLTHQSTALAFFITVSPAAILFLVGANYASKNDLVVGLPLVVTSIFLMVSPYTLAPFVTIPWILIIITQFALMIETKIRGEAMFAQTILTVIVTGISSIAFIAFMLGAFGTGPPAIWPAYVWFNIAMFPNVPMAVQAPTVLTLVLLTLIVRNVAVVGYTRGTEGSGSPIIGILSLLFAFMVVTFGDAKDMTHQALTAAAVIFMLYTISFVLVISLNLSLGSRILKQGHELEGNLIRMSALSGLIIGAGIALYAFALFSGFPTPLEVASVITIVLTLVVGLEILNLITWLSAGIRLGLMKGGFKYKGLQ